MVRRFGLFFCLFLFITLSVHSTAQAEDLPSYQPSLDVTVERLVVVINEQRVAAGLQPLLANPVLMDEAQRFSGIQADLGALSHRGNDGSTGGQRLTHAGYVWSFWGENLAAGQETPEDVVAAWMASPGHRANLLSAKATELGIGHTFRDNDPANYFDYWVMEIAHPR